MGTLCGGFGIPWGLGAHGPALETSQGLVASPLDAQPC